MLSLLTVLHAHCPGHSNSIWLLVSSQALSSDKELFGKRSEEDSGPKISMKKLFERPKVKIDGTPSKVNDGQPGLLGLNSPLRHLGHWLIAKCRLIAKCWYVCNRANVFVHTPGLFLQ
jgi:hypothetical protein